MRQVRYLLLLLALLIGVTTQAQYNPTNPDEPGAKPWQLTLKAIPAEAGYFSLNQQTSHAEGEQMRLQAYNHNNYQFIRWEDENGNILSTNSSLDYTMPSANITLVARYEYTPGPPSEPGQASIKRRLMLKTNPEGAGRFNLNSSSDISTGEVVNLRAYNNKNYYFRNWTQDGAIISTSANFAYTMPSQDVTLVANFDYDYQPDSPNEPGQPTNTYYNIYGVRMDAKAGQTISYPLYLENRGTAVTGFQVDVSLPKGFTTDAKDITLTDRAIGHTLKAEQTTEGTWRINVSGAKVFEDESGQMLILPIHVPDTATIGQVFNISLANGIVVKEGGEQQNVNVRDGSLKILSSDDNQPNSPDYVVTNIQATTSKVLPEGNLSLSWQVKNQGNIVGLGSWTERIYLIGTDGRKVSIGTASFDAKELQPGASVSRSATMTLAQLLGIDGKVDVAITIVPNSNSGEVSNSSTNNTAQTDAQPITVGKRLLLTLPNKPQLEGEVTNIRCQLARSGNWSQAETFMLTKIKGDNRILTPETVVVPREQASVYFYLTLANDDVCNTDSVVSLRIEGNGYDAVEGSFIVTDNELMPLRLTASSTEVTEGDTFQLTVTLTQPTEKPLTVSLTSELPKRFRLPASLVIPAGQTTGTVDVTAIDNEIPDGDVSCAFTAYAAGFEPAETIVILNDNDLPVLELTLTPNKVKESDGPVCITGTLRRLTNIDKKITVRLSDDSDGGLYFSQKELTLAKGVQQATFSLGPVDNSTVDGDRQYTVTAAVWLSSCSCSASGQAAGNVQAQIEVFDDDGPALSLTSSQATVREGVTTRITVTRNTSTEKALTVRLSSDHDVLLTYNHTLVIPAGQQSAYVEVTPAANDTQNDSQTIVFTAESEGFSSGTCYVLVTDQTLPDAVITDINVAESEVEAGGLATVSITVMNQGVAILPAQTCLNLYIEEEPEIIRKLFTQELLNPGESTTIIRQVRIATAPGGKRIHAVVNEEKQVAELSYNNNTSQPTDVRILSPYRITIQSDKTQYLPKDTVILTGSVAGSQSANAEIEVYVINDGLRQTMTITTDNEGKFKACFVPYERQIGHFLVGSCYPGEEADLEMSSFDVLGLKRTSTGLITCDVTFGNIHRGEIELYNPSSIALTNITASITNLPNNCELQFSSIPKIDCGQKSTLTFTLTGKALTEGDDWQEMTINISTSEGASLHLPLYYYCRHAEALLQADVEEINTTMVQGSMQEYSFEITNIGHGETGIINLCLPSWMKASSPLSLPSIGQGESTKIGLLLTTNDDMPLNVPITGHIAVNCEFGNGLSLPFSIEPVADRTGQFIVDVCDVFTFQPVQSGESPHVEGALVTLKHPVTGVVVAEGLTNKNGLFEIEMFGGMYELEVTSDKHEPYSTYINIAAGRVYNQQVILSYKAVSIEWGVVETDVEDEYDITIITQFDTNVPMPVVIIDGPTKVNVRDMAPGESVLLHFTLTNKGLINAEEVTFELPGPNDEWILEALAYHEPFTLSPLSSITIPVLLTRPVSNGSRRLAKVSNVEDIPDILYTHCMAGLGARYKYLCNEDLIENRAAHKMAMGLCGLAQLLDGIFGGGGGENGKPDKPNNKHNEEKEDSGDKWPGKNETICDHDVAQRHLTALKWGTSLLNGLSGIVGGAIIAGMEVAQDIDLDDKIPWKTIAEFVLKPLAKIGLSEYEASMEIAQKPLPWVYNVMKGISDWGELILRNPVVRNIDWIESFDREVAWMVEQYHAFDNLLNEIFGNEVWYIYEDETIIPFWEYIEAHGQTNQNLISLLTLKPDCVSEADVEGLVNHLNRDIQSTRTVRRNLDYDAINRYVSIISGLDDMAQKDGYKDLSDRFFHAYNDYINRLNEASSSVCASVTLEIKQVMTLTRPAYRGTLTVFNGHDSAAMTDARLNLVIKNEYGNIATAHEFQINAESLEGFGGEVSLTSGWTLDAQQTGKATVLFIPTKHAAPAEPVRYSFNGSLTYIDPFTELEVTRDLFPVTITVNPLPDLELNYLMQRDVYGDDPLTEDVVEPKDPAEFALIINNKGYGESENVKILTEQPKIIDNEKGLLIDFQLVSSQVNGEPAVLSFGQNIANNFGTIPAHSQAYGQWWLESSLLGHFTSYEVEATHVTSYGNQNLSLIDTVTIHEMIHGFTDATLLSSKLRRGYLVNDIVDADDLPDVIYFTDASQQPLYISTGNIDRLANSEYMLTATTKQQGWNYGSVTDPTGGKLKLASITRSRDGAELPIDNMWQTSRTLRDAREWLYENRLHYVVWLPESGESYLLKFTEDDIVGIGTVETDGKQKGNIHLHMSGGWLTVTGNFHELRSIELYDLRGVKQITTARQQQGQTVNISSLPSGVYFVRVNTDQGTYHAKVLKK